MSGSAAGLDSAIEQYAEQLLALDSTLAGNINALSKKLKAAAGDASKLEKVKEEAGAALQKAKDDIEQDIAYKFFQEDPNLNVPSAISATSNPYAAFKNMFNHKEGLDRVRRLKERIAEIKDPQQQEIVNSGLKVAFARYYDEAGLATQRGASGARNVQARKIEQFEQSKSQVYKIGDEIFKGQPEVMATIRQLGGDAKDLQQTKAGKSIPGSPTAMLQNATKAVSRIIQVTVGPLTRGGAQAKAATGALFEKLDVTGAAKRASTNILSDPDTYIRLLRNHLKDPSAGRAEEMLRKFLFRGVLTKTDTDEQTDNMLEEGAANTIDKVREIGESAVKKVSKEANQIAEGVTHFLPN